MLVSAELNTLSELSLIFNQFVIHPGVSTPGCFLLGLFRVQTGPDMTPVQVTPPTFRHTQERQMGSMQISYIDR